jgi:hypothetical protein
VTPSCERYPEHYSYEHSLSDIVTALEVANNNGIVHGYEKRVFTSFLSANSRNVSCENIKVVATKQLPFTISRSNFMIVAQAVTKGYFPPKNVVLMGWSFAVKQQTEYKYKGSLQFTPNQVLTQLQKNQDRITALPCNDLESLVKVVWFLKRPADRIFIEPLAKRCQELILTPNKDTDANTAEELNLQQALQKLQETWEHLLNFDYWRTGLQLASKRDYEGLRNWVNQSAYEYHVEYWKKVTEQRDKESAL